MSSSHRFDPAVAIIGLGPRGISMIERIGAWLAASGRDQPLVLHLVEDSQPGAGRVWRSDQTRTLCMNTLAGAVTLFTEPGSSVGAPVRQGPTLYEWIQFLRGEQPADEEHRCVLESTPPSRQVAAEFAGELAVTRPESNPSRALYGSYLRWCLEVALAGLPERVSVVEHRSRLVRISDQGDVDLLELADQTCIEAGATVLATGWQVPGATAAEAELDAAVAQNPGLVWVRPGNPLDQEIDARVPDEAAVLVRGLGMGFFDLMALVTIDRGGCFVKESSARGGLRYRPSGREPHLTVASGRGYPFLPKSEYGGLPPRAALPRLRSVVASIAAQHRGPDSIDFDAEVRPAVLRDAHEAYYRTLARTCPQSIHGSVAELVSALDRHPVEDLALAVDGLVSAEHRLDLASALDPLAGVVGLDVPGLTRMVADGLAGDITEAERGADSPLKAALWSLSSSRKPCAVLGEQGRYTAASRDGFAALMRAGQMVGSGPPCFRSRQLLALVDAGLVDFLGARPALVVARDGFEMSSATSGSEPVRAPVLVDAWMHDPDIRRPGDPLMAGLVEDARTRPFCVAAGDGSRLPTNSPEVDPATRRLVLPDGGRDRRVHLVGIPTSGQLADTTISPMPGTNSLMLQETDRTARSALLAVGLLDEADRASGAAG